MIFASSMHIPLLVWKGFMTEVNTMPSLLQQYFICRLLFLVTILKVCCYFYRQHQFSHRKVINCFHAPNEIPEETSKDEIEDKKINLENNKGSSWKTQSI